MEAARLPLGRIQQDTHMTTFSQADAGRAFLAMHQTKPGFILPNAWDAGSAMLLASAGFPAIATTSGGIAFSLGKPDYHMGDPKLGVSRDEMFARIREIVAAVRVPVSADLEAGYGDEPEAVADTIRLAIDAGLAGGNIEDRIPGQPALYDEKLAVVRIRAARAAIAASGVRFVLNARTDAFVMTKDGLAAAIRRANLFREAGADCVFTPGVPDIYTVQTLVREIRAPLNVVSGLGAPTLDPKTLIAAGVQRVSLGASIARAALNFVREAAQEVRERGTIGYASRQIPQAELNLLFGRARAA
jgi:2-methylisocitrate lyase-like PEP mutase family enzyme